MMAVAIAACQENAVTRADPGKLLRDIWPALNRDHGRVGIIGNGQIEAAILLQIQPFWYGADDEPCLLERAIFVAPEYRSAKVGRARLLCEWAKQASDTLEMQAVIGVLSNDRTEAKNAALHATVRATGGHVFHLERSHRRSNGVIDDGVSLGRWSKAEASRRQAQGQSTVSIPPEVLARYSAVNQQAQTTAQIPFQQYSTDPNAFVAGLSPTQEAGIVGTNQYSSEAQPFYQTASNMTQAGSASGQSDEPEFVRHQQIHEPVFAGRGCPTSALMEQRFIRRNRPTRQRDQSGGLRRGSGGRHGGQSATATGAWRMGRPSGGLEQCLQHSSRNRPATARRRSLSPTGNRPADGWRSPGSQYRSRSTDSRAGWGASPAYQGQAQQQTEQAGLTALYNQFLQQQSYPFQTTQFLANIAEGTGALSGSSTASTSTSPAPFFSDERLKEDIEPIGKTFDGTNIVKFRYKGSPHKQIGLLAQDVERKHPEAVGFAGGYKTVDYDAATKHASSMGGLGAGSERKAYAYGGLSPNWAYNSGFYVDPSYLNSQEEAYANAPWSNVGPVNGNIPGKGRNIPSGSAGLGHLRSAAPKLGANSRTVSNGSVRALARSRSWASRVRVSNGPQSVLRGNTSPASAVTRSNPGAAVEASKGTYNAPTSQRAYRKHTIEQP